MINKNVTTMHQCYYQLQIYEDLIYGDLEPARLQGDKLDTVIKYLDQEFDKCQNMQIIDLYVSKKEVILLQKINVSNAHPLGNKYFFQRDLENTDKIEDQLSKKVLKELDINLDEVQFTVSKVDKHLQRIEFCENSFWNKFSKDRIKYCYYYQILSECTKDFKRTIRLKAFESNESEFRKLISNVQKTLMFYIKELYKLHKIDLSNVKYGIKDNYSKQDYISVIYISLVEKLNFLYENFSEEFNKNHPVPYYSEKINVNKISEKISDIQEYFDERGTDVLLEDIICEQFGRIVIYEHPNRVTYHELDYFIDLINEFTKQFLTQDSVTFTDDDIVSFLISHKFNHLNFIHYVTNKIRKDINSISDLTKKKLRLLYHRNFVKQSFEFSDKMYDPNARSASVVIQDWIANEVKLVKQYSPNKVDNPVINQNESLKLKTSLSIRQLSVLIKTLSDCDIILSNSQTDLARWICANFKNENSENFSVDQARNHLYNKDPMILERIKDLGIEIMNVINEKLAAKD